RPKKPSSDGPATLALRHENQSGERCKKDEQASHEALGPVPEGKLAARRGDANRDEVGPVDHAAGGAPARVPVLVEDEHVARICGAVVDGDGVGRPGFDRGATVARREIRLAAIRGVALSVRAETGQAALTIAIIRVEAWERAALDHADVRNHRRERDRRPVAAVVRQTGRRRFFLVERPVALSYDGSDW